MATPLSEPLITSTGSYASGLSLPAVLQAPRPAAGSAAALPDLGPAAAAGVREHMDGVAAASIGGPPDLASSDEDAYRFRTSDGFRGVMHYATTDDPHEPHLKFKKTEFAVSDLWLSYQGGVNGDKFHGIGKLIFRNGDIYKGSFSQGHFHGEGVFYKPSESGYTGRFEMGKRKGYGILVFADSRPPVEGHWENDALKALPAPLKDEDGEGSGCCNRGCSVM